MNRDTVATITIRRARRRDIPALLNLYGAFEGEPDDDADDAPRLTAGAADAVFDRIDADGNQSLLVAERDGLVVGTLALLIVPSLARGGQPWAVVDTIALHDSARGQGIGTLLMEEAVQRARGARCYKLVLSTHRSRVDAQRLYARLGLQQTHLGYEIALS